MKKSIKLLVVTSILVLAMAVAAFAANTAVSVSYTEAGADGVHKITASVEDTVGVKLLGLFVSFDTDVVIPYDAALVGDAFDVTNTSTFETVVLGTNAYQDPNNLGIILDGNLENVPTIWEIDPATGRTAVKFTFQTTSNLKAAKTGAVFSFTFKLAENKTIEDAAFALEGVDTTFAYMKKAGFNVFGGVNTVDKNDYESTVANDAITFEAFFEEEPVVLTIPVTAGDVIYEGNKAPVVAAETGDYTLSITEGVVVVNTGFTAQKFYNVEDGAVTEDTSLANGVLSTNRASIRDDDTHSGIRYMSTFLTALKSKVSEYGYLVTAENTFTGLKDTEYELNMALHNSGLANKAVAYNGEKDIYWNVEGANTVVTAVVTNVPETEEAVQTYIATRPYYILKDGTVVYGETMRKTVYEVAYSIKKNDSATYQLYKDYIDRLLALVKFNKEPTIDLSPLFPAV